MLGSMGVMIYLCQGGLCSPSVSPDVVIDMLIYPVGSNALTIHTKRYQC